MGLFVNTHYSIFFPLQNVQTDKLLLLRGLLCPGVCSWFPEETTFPGGVTRVRNGNKAKGTAGQRPSFTNWPHLYLKTYTSDFLVKVNMQIRYFKVENEEPKSAKVPGMAHQPPSLARPHTRSRNSPLVAGHTCKGGHSQRKGCVEVWGLNQTSTAVYTRLESTGHTGHCVQVNLDPQLNLTCLNPYEHVTQEADPHISPPTARLLASLPADWDVLSQTRKTVTSRGLTGSYVLDSLGKGFERHPLPYLYLMEIVPMLPETFHLQNLISPYKLKEEVCLNDYKLKPPYDRCPKIDISPILNVFLKL